MKQIPDETKPSSRYGVGLSILESGIYFSFAVPSDCVQYSCKPDLYCLKYVILICHDYVLLY